MTYGNVLGALADPTRRAILELLRDGPLSVTALADEMPVSRPAVSQHLGVLKAANLVREEKDGTRRIYEASPEGLDELRRYLENTWGEILGQYASSARRKKRGR
ncbi:MAG TPA: metalloregulator ArsR/SmtB family transcription factor [Thermoanaerobaculia bacterium]|nr:metalloregulator ArsR/SmtB family transcription factor [Thermoanaerobaculia bacterium]